MNLYFLKIRNVNFNTFDLSNLATTVVFCVLQDKTFGLKNKKGAKQQRFVQQVEKQVKTGGIAARKLGEPDKLKDKDAKAKEAAELNLLFRPVTTQKVVKGVLSLTNVVILCCCLLLSFYFSVFYV